MKTKTPLIIAISSGLTLALVLTSTAMLELLRRDDNNAPSSDPVSSPAQPAQPAQPAPAAPASNTWTQAENDYLFDLSLALLPQERQRASEAEKLNIGRKVQGWLEGGADYWTVRKKFDETYQSTILDNYTHNRDVYIKFATERFAASHRDTLTPPPQVVRVTIPSQSNSNNQNNTPDSGNPIPEREAIVIESGYLNCRATPNGLVVDRLNTNEIVKVNRIAYGTGKAWYLTTRGCWAFGGGLSFATSPSPTPTPLPTPMPTPLPTPMPTPLPTPMPTPMPTPLPTPTPLPSPTPSP
jgi:hypothetical protein